MSVHKGDTIITMFTKVASRLLCLLFAKGDVILAVSVAHKGDIILAVSVAHKVTSYSLCLLLTK